MGGNLNPPFPGPHSPSLFKLCFDGEDHPEDSVDKQAFSEDVIFKNLINYPNVMEF